MGTRFRAINRFKCYLKNTQKCRRLWFTSFVHKRLNFFVEADKYCLFSIFKADLASSSSILQVFFNSMILRFDFAKLKSLIYFSGNFFFLFFKLGKSLDWLFFFPLMMENRFSFKKIVLYSRSIRVSWKFSSNTLFSHFQLRNCKVDAYLQL